MVDHEGKPGHMGWHQDHGYTAHLSSPLISKALQSSLSALANSAPISPPTLHHNIKWSNLCIYAIPIGKTDHQGAYTSDEAYKALIAENPSYATLTVTQEPSLVRNPESYSNGSSSSLTVSFEDPDRSAAQALLHGRTLFAFGQVATVTAKVLACNTRLDST